MNRSLRSCVKSKAVCRWAELCREHGMSNASFYKWRAKYGGMDASMIAQTQAVEEESKPLRRHWFEPNGARG